MKSGWEPIWPNAHGTHLASETDRMPKSTQTTSRWSVQPQSPGFSEREDGGNCCGLRLPQRKKGSWRFSDLPTVMSSHTVIEQEPRGSFYGTVLACQGFSASPQLCSQREPAPRQLQRVYTLSRAPPAPPVPGQRDSWAGQGLTQGASPRPGFGPPGEGAEKQHGQPLPALVLLCSKERL